MLPKLSTTTKTILALLCFAIAIYGFMIKLPSSFRRYDKELHSLFYFMAAAFLNILFVGNKLVRHIVVFVFLYLFGMAIEFSQEYSNKLLRSRIHGRYDVEDVQANLKGLIVFSAIWMLWALLQLAFRKSNGKSID